MRIVLLVCILLSAGGAYAIDPKPLVQVDATALSMDLQSMSADDRQLDLAWWIPVEFWEVTFRQASELPSDSIDEMMGILGRHSVLAVVQADISAFGAFRFYDKESVMNGLRVQAIDADGVIHDIPHTEPSDPDVRLMLDQLRPMLAQAMGNMGENFYFLPLPAFNDDGERRPSPYEKGLLRVTFEREETSSVVEITLPADSLFVPRICPNGEPAHVSWSYCPWSGKKLPK